MAGETLTRSREIPFAPARRLLHSIATIILVTLLSACSSPEERAESHYQRALELLEAGKPVKAGLEFRSTLQIMEDHAPAWKGLLQVEEGLGHWDQVVGILGRITELEPQNIDAQVKLGKLLLSAGVLDQATEVSQAALDIDDGNAKALAFRAAILFKLEDTEGAVFFARRALGHDPNNLDALMVLAVERLGAGDGRSALGHLDQAIQAHEGNIGLKLIKVEILSRVGNLSEAEGIFLQLIALYPERIQLRKSLARFYMRQERHDDAEQIVRKVAEDYPADVEAQMDVVRFLHSHRGVELAEAELKSYIATHPDDYDYSFALAQIQLERGDRPGAKRILNQIAKKAGPKADGITAVNFLIEMSLREGDYETAETLVKKVLKVDAKNIDALIFRGTVSLQRNEIDSAIADFRTAVDEMPKAVRALLLLGQAHETNGAKELARERFSHAFRYSSGDADVGLSYVRFLLKYAEYQRAEDVLLDILAKSPDNMEVLEVLARTRLARQDWLGAQEIAESILRLGRGDGLSSEITGLAYAGQNKYDESITSLHKAFRDSPMEARPLVSLIRVFVQSGKLGDAEKFLRSLGGKNTNNFLQKILLAQILDLGGKVDEAEAFINDAMKMQPNNVAAYSTAFRFYFEKERFGSARDTVDAGLEALPGNFLLRLMHASLSEQEQKFDEAIEEYEELLKQRPSSEIVINNLASLLTDFGKGAESHKRALVLAERLRGSEIPQFKDTLGWAYYRTGQIERAIDLIEEVVGQIPGHPAFRYHLGAVYLADQKVDAAREELQSALDLSEAQLFRDKDEAQELLNGM